MNILVIGNGFDLAHGLPTKYTDFLFFCDMILKIVEVNGVEYLIPSNKEDYKKWLNDGSKIPLANTNDLFKYYNEEYSIGIPERDKRTYRAILDDYFVSDFLSDKYDIQIKKEIIYLVYNNDWIEYFLQCDMHGNENWIDFESEISNVIQNIDGDIYGLSDLGSIEDIVHNLSNEFFEVKYLNYIDAVRPVNPVINGVSGGITFKEIRDKLLDDLNGIIRGFEIYLTEYVEKIECQLISPDIQNILSKEPVRINGISIINVLSFNYTNTYQRLYADKIEEYKYFEKYIDYIHGKADINNSIESNNMVLGIDEYLPKKRKNKDIKFIAFKKYYQRIHKQTGCKYKEWVDEIRESWEGWTESFRKEASKYISGRIIEGKEASINNIKEITHNLYIFGHSLDDTDKDILKDLILNDNVKTIIFYHNKNTMGKQIANLVKVIGQDELIRRTGGSTKTIEFKLQQDMVPIND
jgi:hypothetical protein